MHNLLSYFLLKCKKITLNIQFSERKGAMLHVSSSACYYKSQSVYYTKFIPCIYLCLLGKCTSSELCPRIL